MPSTLLVRAALPFDRQTARAVLTAIMVVALAVILRNAWICDDALITVRCILNALHGYGPTFNIDERVQAFTHPLWFLCATPLTALIGSPWIALLILSVSSSMLCIWLIFSRLGQNGWAGLAGCCILLLSKAFLDYTTSGLETPLSAALVLAVIASGMRLLAAGRQGGITAFLVYAGLAYLNRADVMIVLAPFICVVVARTCRTPREMLAAVAIASVPVLAWTLFSLAYYGFIFPNTAYAKLGGAIPLQVRLLQGWVYVFDSLGRDSITLPAIVIGIVVGLRRDLASAALACGMAIYLIYVVRIGGDQMSGRYFVTPLVVAVAILARTRQPTARMLAIMASLAVLGAINLPATVLADTQMAGTSVAPTGIADERGIFFHTTGLVRVSRHFLAPPAWPKHVTAIASVKMIECGGLGIQGIADGPSVHIADQCALADPFLARLPAAPNPNWRIGHLNRDMPAGYADSLAQNANRIADPKLAKLYDAIRLITRGNYFSLPRLRAIVRLNLGLGPPG